MKPLSMSFKILRDQTQRFPLVWFWSSQNEPKFFPWIVQSFKNRVGQPFVMASKCVLRSSLPGQVPRSSGEGQRSCSRNGKKGEKRHQLNSYCLPPPDNLLFQRLVPFSTHSEIPNLFLLEVSYLSLKVPRRDRCSLSIPQCCWRDEVYKHIVVSSCIWIHKTASSTS